MILPVSDTIAYKNTMYSYRGRLIIVADCYRNGSMWKEGWDITDYLPNRMDGEAVLHNPLLLLGKAEVGPKYCKLRPFTGRPYYERGLNLPEEDTVAAYVVARKKTMVYPRNLSNDVRMFLGIEDRYIPEDQEIVTLL
jgi:hypothetical protein